MKIGFNPKAKVTKRHMEALAEFIPVKERGYPVVYWTCTDEFKSRKAACKAMLELLHRLVKAEVYPEAALADLLEYKQASGGRELFIKVN